MYAVSHIKRFLSGEVKVSLNIAVVGFMALGCVSAGTITGIGTASNYIVLDYGSGSQLSVSGGSTTINGTMGLANGGTYNLSGSGSPSTLQYYGGDTGSNSSSIATSTSSSINSALTQAVLDAQTAYTNDEALTPNQTDSSAVTGGNTFNPPVANAEIRN
jgi:hypothetical protein